MSLLPAYTREDHTRDWELSVLNEVLAAIEEGRAPDARHEKGIRHCVYVFRDAADPEDDTQRRKRLIEWFDADALLLIELLHAYCETYWDACKDAKKMLPFAFHSKTEQEAITTALRRIRDTIKLRDQGFALWPPLRQGPCF